MPKINGEAPIDMAAMLEEIEGLKVAGRHPLQLVLDERQEAALKAAAPGTPGGVQWPPFLAWWKSQGWPGSEGTLRKLYRELAGG